MTPLLVCTHTSASSSRAVNALLLKSSRLSQKTAVESMRWPLQAVKAMRFEVGAHKGRDETEEARLERIKAEAELQEALQEAHEEDD